MQVEAKPSVDPHEIRQCRDGFMSAGFPRRHRVGIRVHGDLTLPGDGKARCLAGLESLSQDGGCVLLLGLRGTGKTQLATWLAWNIAERGLTRSMRYAVLADLFADEKATFRHAERGESPIRSAGATGLLVLDDVHERGDTDWEDRELVRLFDRRYREMLRTVLIANMPLAEAPTKLPASMWSRLVETGTVVDCNWPSFRTGANVT